jgi:hypothetical protein
MKLGRMILWWALMGALVTPVVAAQSTSQPRQPGQRAAQAAIMKHEQAINEACARGEVPGREIRDLYLNAKLAAGPQQVIQDPDSAYDMCMQP